MTTPFGDRLVESIRSKNAAVCVGLDPLTERLPESLRAEHGLDEAPTPIASAEAIQAFCSHVIERVAPLVPVVKINIAFFERYHAAGINAYYQLVQQAQDAGLLVIGDVKRADIGHSATQYARAQLAPFDDPKDGAPDAVTVNPYLGFDGIAPFVETAREYGKGVFVLVATSNESAAEFQGLSLAGGEKLVERVARVVQGWASGAGLVGSSGYSCIGAVVAPNTAADAARIRQMMPNCMFLVPGVGAQGRSADDVRPCFKADGTGALINASRSVIYAFAADRYRNGSGDWGDAVVRSCNDLVTSIRAITA